MFRFATAKYQYFVCLFRFKDEEAKVSEKFQSQHVLRIIPVRRKTRTVTLGKSNLLLECVFVTYRWVMLLLCRSRFVLVTVPS